MTWQLILVPLYIGGLVLFTALVFRIAGRIIFRDDDYD